MKQQYEGIENLIGPNGFKTIRNSHVLIVGIGGVGSWCAESLARSGVGEITLLDMDEICVSNINRQIHALPSTVGQSKVNVMSKRIKEIDDSIIVHALFDFLSESTKELIQKDSFDFIIDAIDSVGPKALLHSLAQKFNLPIICTGGTGARLNPTSIVINDLNKSVNDKLLKQLKRKLRKEYQFSKFTNKPFRIPTVFSTEIPLDTSHDEHVLKNSRKINCQSGLGSASFVTASFGMAAVSYVIQELIKESND